MLRLCGILRQKRLVKNPTVVFLMYYRQNRNEPVYILVMQLANAFESDIPWNISLVFSWYVHGSIFPYSDWLCVLWHSIKILKTLTLHLYFYIFVFIKFRHDVNSEVISNERRSETNDIDGRIYFLSCLIFSRHIGSPKKEAGIRLAVISQDYFRNK